MRRQLFVIGLFALLLASSFGSAFADPPKPDKEPRRTPTGASSKSQQSKEDDQGVQQSKEDNQGGKRHGVFGTITVISGASFTVSTKQGNVFVTTTDNTKIHIPTKRDATVSDLQTDDRVAVSGTPTGSGLTAKNVSVAPGKPTVQHRVGVVQSYKEGQDVDIQDMQGETESFKLTADTEIMNPKGTGIQVGDRVTVVSRRGPETGVFTGQAIVVHPE